MNREAQTVYRYAWAIMAIFVCVVLLLQVFGFKTQAVMSFAKADVVIYLGIFLLLVERVLPRS
jgi:hypothetical protein